MQLVHRGGRRVFTGKVTLLSVSVSVEKIEQPLVSCGWRGSFGIAHSIWINLSLVVHFVIWRSDCDEYRPTESETRHPEGPAKPKRIARTGWSSGNPDDEQRLRDRCTASSERNPTESLWFHFCQPRNKRSESKTGYSERPQFEHLNDLFCVLLPMIEVMAVENTRQKM
jgi:hypothetical protein